ncbi:MAG: phage tail sheath C-terminal domain-containing protein [Bacteroidota bacterium]
MKKVLLFLFILSFATYAIAQSTYKTPGVYIEEISTLPASVAEVETAIPAFIGFTEKGAANQPILIESTTDYKKHFGGAFKASFDVQLQTSAGYKDVDHITRTSEDHFYLHYAIQHFFLNGGKKCYIIPAGNYEDRNTATGLSRFSMALSAIEEIDEVTILVFPDALFLSHSEYYEVVDEALTQCSDLGDRFTLVDIHTSDLTNTSAIKTELKTGQNFRNANLDLQNLMYGAAYTPHLVTRYQYRYDVYDVAINLAGMTGVTMGDQSFRQNNPVLFEKIELMIGRMNITLPPSAAMAGIYSKVDGFNGVWKAPANISIKGVNALSAEVTASASNNLNVDTNSGKSINAIRRFIGRGMLVWGSRTLAGNDNEWRYIPTRRTFNMVEESIKKSTFYAVFEQNDANTWSEVRGVINNYLTDLWRKGALAGVKPEEAFYVKVGLGETMTAQDVLEKRMIIEIGMAMHRPAEFVTLRITHLMEN